MIRVIKRVGNNAEIMNTAIFVERFLENSIMVEQ